MIVPASWITFAVHVCGLGIVFGNSYSDPERCIQKAGGVSARYNKQFCWSTKDNQNLVCPGKKKIVLLSVEFPIKVFIDECTKRVLNSEDSFCCSYHKDDVFYGGDCLQNVWNTEDRQHYQQFIIDTLQKCSNRKRCILREEMFVSLQREIPRTRKFSSYLQINHECIPAPDDVIDMCSSKSISGKEIHIQNSLVSTDKANETCTCHVSSGDNGKVILRAMDVRVANSGLTLKYDNRIKDLSHHEQPLFGFKDILTEKEFDITIVKVLHNTADNVWLQLTGSYGQDVTVTCEGRISTTTARPTEATTNAVTTTSLPYPVTPRLQEVVAEHQDGDFLEDYWPMIYLGAGSGITIVLVVCVVGSILICRYSMIKEKRKGQYGNPYRHSQVNYNRSGQYDTVLDDMQHIPGYMVASNQETLEWR